MNRRIPLPRALQKTAAPATPDPTPCLPALGCTPGRLLAWTAAALRRAEKAVTEGFRVPPNGA